MAKKKDPTAAIVALMVDDPRVFDEERIIWTSHDIKRQLAARAEQDELEAQFRQERIDELFPNRKKGKLYQVREQEEIIDY